MLDEDKNIIKKLAIALAAAVFLTLFLILAIKSGYKFVIWIYFGVLAVSAIIDRWFYGQQHNNAFLTINEHIFHACAITLFTFWIATQLFM